MLAKFDHFYYDFTERSPKTKQIVDFAFTELPNEKLLGWFTNLLSCMLYPICVYDKVLFVKVVLRLRLFRNALYNCLRDKEMSIKIELTTAHTNLQVNDALKDLDHDKKYRVVYY
jgi:hypothetical protein